MCLCMYGSFLKKQSSSCLHYIFILKNKDTGVQYNVCLPASL
jgi:hypothetical protein